MKKRIRLKGRIRTYIQFTLYLGLLLLAIDAAVFMLDFRAGLLTFGFTIFYFAITLTLYFYNKPIIMNELISFATEYGQIQRKLLRDLELPYALLDDSGKVIWTNIAFENVVHQPKGYSKSITSLFPTITRDRLPDESGVDEAQYELEYEGCEYVAKFRKISLKEMAEHSDMIDAEGYNGYLIAVYLFDETALHIALQEVDDQSLTVGMIYLDNYEEALESVEEVRRSLLIALIDRKVNKYIAALDGISKKLEKDKYLVIMRKKAVAQLQENRFDLLEEVKTVNIGNEMAVTISIGIGLDGLTYAQNYEFARTAIDLALGRGGDQAVIKGSESEEFYGGKRVSAERNTRVKARVKAHALKELIESKERVVVMGHSIGDADSFGASVGVYRIAKTLERKAYVVLDQCSPSVRPLCDRFYSGDYEDGMIVNREEAGKLVDENALLVIVDVNKADYTECPELVEQAQSVVVIDHHRQAGDAISQAVLFYIEPYASSASEMVSEISQYIGNGLKLKPAEAEALYAGIMIDTNNFTDKTGVRTFEAMAYLRRNGVDVIRLRKAFRENMDEYRIKAAAIEATNLYLDSYAITESKAEGTDSPTVLAAKIANELLDISGVKASFVLTNYNDKIYISARSIDEVNVQVMMEKLGGGGHINMAGAQLKDCTVSEAEEKLRTMIDKMIEDGDITQ